LSYKVGNIKYNASRGPVQMDVSEGLLPSLHHEDGGSQVLRNTGVLPQNYTASQPTIPRREFSSSWKIQVS